MPAILEAQGITKSFPGVQALVGVDFDVRPGEVHALLGENGAGKSTLVNILTGVYVADGGTVLVRGTPAAFASPRDAALAGIRVIHQELALVPQLSVGTNLVLGDIPLRKSKLARAFGLVDRAAMSRRAEEALSLVGNPVSAHATAGATSVAQAQLIEIGRALASNFKVLILDEPTSALSASERDELFAHLRRFRELGIGIVYISHRLEEVIAIADRATILRDGRVIAHVLRENFSLEGIVQLMSGTARKAAAPSRKADHDEDLLSVDRLTREPAVRGVSFTLRAGEVVGLTGLVGAGRTELARCIFGADAIDSGTISLRGAMVTPRSPREAIEMGIGYVTEDRKAEGIVHTQTVRENIMLGAFSRRGTASAVSSRGGFVKRRAAARMVADLAAEVGVRPADPGVLAGSLSGGNQQKVVLARWLASRVSVLILDEPTRGIDVASKREIWARIRRMAADGMGILAISSEVPELLEYADRILVMKAGYLVGEIAHDDATEAEVVHLAGGRN